VDTKETAMDRAQRRADHEGEKFEVWEHVGDYGRPGGDIPARHTFRVLPFESEPGDGWAMIAIAEPKS
jgi:hypothetical protein